MVIFWSCRTISSLISSASGTSSCTQESLVSFSSVAQTGHDLLPDSFHCSMQNVQNVCKQERITSFFRSMQMMQQSSSCSKLNFGSLSSWLRIAVGYKLGLELAERCLSSLADIASRFVTMVLKTCRNCFRLIIRIWEIFRDSGFTDTHAIFIVAFHSH